MKKIDYTAWCDDSIKAGPRLAEVLNERNDPKVNLVVNRIIQKFNERLKYISDQNNYNACSEYFTILLLKETRKNIVNINLEYPINTLLDNVIVSKYRKLLKTKQ
jgi:hypothetical protein